MDQGSFCNVFQRQYVPGLNFHTSANLDRITDSNAFRSYGSSPQAISISHFHQRAAVSRAMQQIYYRSILREVLNFSFIPETGSCVSRRTTSTPLLNQIFTHGI